MRSAFARRFPVMSSRPRRATAPRRPSLGVDPLESRRLLAITPGTVYDATTPATWTDADGDTVTVSLTGSTSGGAGFTVELAGLATDFADATRINLVGLTGTNGLQVVVTPNKLSSQPGTNFADLYSAGYTNVAFISNEPPAAPMASLGGIQLSAAVVHSISLDGVAIGNITLDAGQAPYIDRINSQNNQQGTDSKFYQPVTGLIDLGGITAASIGSLVINGAISAPTGNPFDTSVTNDFRSVVNVSGSIGSVIGLRSSLSGAIRADSIGSVRVASIAGEITTRGNADLAVNLPTTFKGFINSGGHLHLGFPLSDGALITGQINAAGGISGSDRSSTTDTLYLPGGYAGSFSNTSSTVGVADIEVDGEAMLVVQSASSVGDISADAFTGDFIVEAGTSIGDVTAGTGLMAGHLDAGTDIGNVRAARGIIGTILAGDDIGTITVVEGSVESPSIQAGGDIGRIRAYAGILGTSIVAGGDLGTPNIASGDLEGILVNNGDIELSYVRARDIGSISVVDGGMQTVSLVAGRDVGEISTFGSIGGFGIQDVSVVAGRDVAAIDARAHTGYGIRLLKLEAGGDAAGITGISYGEFGALDGAGILDSNFVAANIGPVYGRGVGGVGIEDTRVITRTAYDPGGGIDKTRGRIGAVTGEGWLDGLRDVTVVAHTDIASISGISLVDGTGINAGSFDANYGGIGQITAAGGAAGGYGILDTRFQATDLQAGRIAGIVTSSNANGLDAMNGVKVYAGSIGPIKATVHGGLEGNGIVAGEIQSFAGAIDSIDVTVRSVNGIGIVDGKVTASGDIGPMTVWAFNNTAISGGTYQSRGDFGAMNVTAEKRGNGIEDATFTAPGRIDDPASPSPTFDPKGSFGAITVNANGTSPQSNGIVGTKFSAIGDIGQVTVRSRGGTGILHSDFLADTDGDYNPAPSLASPGQSTGAIAGISVAVAGRNLVDSSGIVTSTFKAANIGAVSVAVQSVEGGDGIVDSSFSARTAVYDDRGNFDNTGTIGNVAVTNASDQLSTGAGISGTLFLAGAAGGIGNVTVTTASGSGIILSIFDASVVGIDLDQNLYTSTIGNISVTTGRVFNATLTPAGITGSAFTSAAGIGTVTVNSIGSGITASVFVADFDWSFLGSPAGDIGNITVRVPGRNASAVTGSQFVGAGIGNIDVRLANNAQNGLNAVASSSFTARSGAIGNITVVHSLTGPGFAILTSAFSAATGIGTISITGNTLGAVFIVAGQPVVVLGQGVGPKSLSGSIGAISLLGGNSHDLSLTSASRIAGLSFTDAPIGATVKLALSAPSVGNLVVDSPLGTASLDVSGSIVSIGDVNVDGGLTIVASAVTTIGNVTTGGNASLTTRALQTLGNLVVGGTLSLPQDLASLRQAGTFTVNSLASTGRNVRIGSSTNVGSSIGRIQIANANRGKGVYQFAFSAWPSNPSTSNPVATIGGRAIVAAGTSARTVNGVSIVRTRR